jgi:multimeric flavodoxin WrbA
MKTLIFNGSPRKNGDTTALLNEFMKRIEGEFKIVDAFDCNIKSCTDCRFCWEHDGCNLIDDMQDVYDYIQECDNILIASPVFFTELTGQLLVVASRLQTYFCARYFRKETPIKKRKKGGIVLVQGGSHQADKAVDTAKMLLNTMNAENLAPVVFCLNADSVPPADNKLAMDGVRGIAHLFNETQHQKPKRYQAKG